MNKCAKDWATYHKWNNEQERHVHTCLRKLTAQRENASLSKMDNPVSSEVFSCLVLYYSTLGYPFIIITLGLCILKWLIPICFSCGICFHQEWMVLALQLSLNINMFSSPCFLQPLRLFLQKLVFYSFSTGIRGWVFLTLLLIRRVAFCLGSVAKTASCLLISHSTLSFR